MFNEMLRLCKNIRWLVNSFTEVEF